MAFPSTLSSLTGATPRNAPSNAGILNALEQIVVGPIVINVNGKGAVGDGIANDTAAWSAAIAALPATGGTIVAPSPAYKVDGGFVLPRGTRIVGGGRRATRIIHTGNNTCFSAVVSTDLSAPPTFEHFTLEGNAGAAAIGIEVGNVFKALFFDIEVRNYTAGTGILLHNSVNWTEGATFIQVAWRTNLNHLRFAVSGTGTNSFAETTTFGCNMILDTVANCVGFNIPVGTFLYGGHLQCKFNFEITTGTGLLVAGVAQQNTVALFAESAIAGTLLNVTGTFKGIGQLNADPALTLISGAGTVRGILSTATGMMLVDQVAGDTSDVDIRIGTHRGASQETGVIKWDNVATGTLRALVLDTWASANPVRLGGSEVDLAQESLLGVALAFTEIADPAAPAANKARLYARDNGSGKTQLVVVFPTGAVQVLATEP